MKEIDEPGVNFIYQSGVTQLLALSWRRLPGRNSAIMYPANYGLRCTPRKAPLEPRPEGRHGKAYCCFNGNARDFARFGQLLLNNGQWDDRAIDLSRLFGGSDKPDTRLVYKDLGKPNHCYGFQYWILDYKGMKIPYMRGILGQYVFTLPEKNAVIVRLGHKRSDTYTADQHYPDDINTWLDAAMDLLQ